MFFFRSKHAGCIANVPKSAKVLFKILSCFLLLKKAVFTKNGTKSADVARLHKALSFPPFHSSVSPSLSLGKIIKKSIFYHF